MARAARTSIIAPLAFAALAASAIALAPAHAVAAPPHDAVAEAFAGQIIFVDVAPPPRALGVEWYAAHRITQRAETTDKKWPLHMVVVLRAPLEKARLDIAITKAVGRDEPLVQKLVFFPTGDGRVHYFAVSLSDPPYQASTRYRFRANAGGSTSADALAEGTLELLPATAAPAIAFDADAAQDALLKVLYQDCKSPGSPGGDAKLLVVFAAKDGKVARASFAAQPAVPYSAATQACVLQRFRAVKIKEFSGADRVVPFTITIG